MFTGAFLKQLRVPGQELSELMRNVRAEVYGATKGRQNPRVDDGMKEPFYFISPEQLSALAEAALKAKKDEITRLEKEISKLQAQINASRDAQARQALEVEQQRQQALAATKRQESEALAKETELQRQRAEEAARKARKRAAVAAEHARQQEELAALAAARQAELERLAHDAASDSPDVLIETIEQLDKVLAEVEAEYAAVWLNTEAKLREGYKPRFAALTTAKPEIYETDVEFNSRVQQELASLEKEMESTIAARKEEWEAEQAHQILSMRKQYKDALQILATKTWVLQGQGVHLRIGEYDRNARSWPFTVTSADPSIPVESRIIIADLNKTPNVRQAIIDLDTAVKTGALVGRIEWSLRRNREKGWYELIIRQVSVVNLTTNSPVASWQGEDFVAYFTPGKRQSPTKFSASLRLTSPVPGARVFQNGHELGAIPLDVNLPPGAYRLEVRWPDGKIIRISGKLEPGTTESRVVKKTFLDTMTMLPIPGGIFIMGSPSDGLDDERPVSRVTLSSFLMSATEVTQAQYQAVMGTNPSHFKSGWDASQRPVDSVTWYDAILFCNRLSQLEGLEPAYYSPSLKSAIAGIRIVLSQSK